MSVTNSLGQPLKRFDPEPDEQRQRGLRGGHDYERDARHRTPDVFSFKTRQALRERAERRRRADRTLILELLSGLLRGEIVGLNLAENLFADVRAGFLTALQELGRVVNPPAARSDSAYVTARGLGLSAESAARIAPQRPRSHRRFDEFMASMPADAATLQAAIDAGNADGLPLGFMDLLSALVGAVRSAALSGDSAALRAIGSDFGAMAAALMEVTGGSAEAAERAPRVRTRRYADEWVEVAPGHHVAKSECTFDKRTGTWVPNPGVLSRGG